jgi:hypothetical protein
MSNQIDVACRKKLNLPEIIHIKYAQRWETNNFLCERKHFFIIYLT